MNISSVFLGGFFFSDLNIRIGHLSFGMHDFLTLFGLSIAAVVLTSLVTSRLILYSLST